MSDEDLGEEEDTGPWIGEYEGDRNEKLERHGMGKAILPNKDTYEGSYMYGKRDGYGVYRFHAKAAHNARYMGEYYQAKKQGTGKFIYPDGSRYEGEWVNDLKDGKGKYYYTNGDVYDGEWSKGLRHGKGRYTYAKDKTYYEGSWRKGKWEGFGEFHFCNYKYVGRFRDNKVRFDFCNSNYVELFTYNKMYGYGKFVFDTCCELHGQYFLDDRDALVFMDLATEAALVRIDEEKKGGEDAGPEAEPEYRMPPSPPPIVSTANLSGLAQTIQTTSNIERRIQRLSRVRFRSLSVSGPTHFEAGPLTRLHVMTPEEEEEARLVAQLNSLRERVEAQIKAKQEAEMRRADAEAARWARLEAERVTEEILAEVGHDTVTE
ncbi:radial spoke head 1 homolog [Plakobranchus ocellatus]|uniref:Radial spoke head 1 homolog n=1 Tax=Plakobranchus ocellatus TaxID=259542 RepID=A0AAV3Y4B4_9GAST|nr:radial spoke head 1 homolog [Plakobranchus ocellatus]